MVLSREVLETLEDRASLEEADQQKCDFKGYGWPLILPSSTFYPVGDEEHPLPHRQCYHDVLPEHMGPSDQNGTFSKL